MVLTGLLAHTRVKLVCLALQVCGMAAADDSTLNARDFVMASTNYKLPKVVLMPGNWPLLVQVWLRGSTQGKSVYKATKLPGVVQGLG